LGRTNFEDVPNAKESVWQGLRAASHLIGAGLFGLRFDFGEFSRAAFLAVDYDGSLIFGCYLRVYVSHWTA